MRILESGDSRFIFSFDDKLFETKDDCLQYEFETLKPGDWIQCINEDGSLMASRAMKDWGVSRKTRYKILELSKSKSTNKKYAIRYFIIKNDVGERKSIALSHLEFFFRVLEKTQLSLIPEIYLAR